LGKHYDSLLDQISAVKFVPASGAATRMFKELFEFYDDLKTITGLTMPKNCLIL
jgi:hypothetical protein